MTATRVGAVTARRVVQVMGMPVSLALRGRHLHDVDADSAWIRVVASLREADLVFSTYRPDSYVSRLARGDVELADCPPEVAEVFDLGEAARTASHGAFNIYRPAADGGTVLDPSGVVKGWAVERAAAMLGELDETDYCLSAGGDLTCRTLDPGGDSWQIGIEDPHDPSLLIAAIPMQNGAVATSGTSHRGRHLVDARTGRPPELVASVTVVAASLIWADIDATAAYGLGAGAADWLAGRPGRSGLVVWQDGLTTVVGESA